MLKGKIQISAAPLAQGITHFFLVGFDDVPCQPQLYAIFEDAGFI